jgi:hypothetical protein
MAEHIEVVSQLSPAVVLERLAQYGKEWRESKIPPSERNKMYGCRITVQGAEFELELEPQGRGPFFIWRGAVVPVDGASGCRILARAHQKTWSRLFRAIAFTLFVTWWAGRAVIRVDRNVDLAVFTVFGSCVMLGIAWAISAGTAAEQGQTCRAIFGQILTTP